MIDDTTVVFPNNAVDLIAVRVPTVDPVPADIHVFKRPLRSSDPTQSVGIVASVWAPVVDSAEMLGKKNFGYTLNRYIITVQALVMDMDEAKGLARHSVLSAKLRALLYRDGPLGVGLSALSVTDSASTERTQKWGVNTQRYMANEVSGSFIYLSNLEMFLETEIR